MAGTDALLDDTRFVLRGIDAGKVPDRVRRAVIENDQLDMQTLNSRKTAWGEGFRSR